MSMFSAEPDNKQNGLPEEEPEQPGLPDRNAVTAGGNSRKYQETFRRMWEKAARHAHSLLGLCSTSFILNATNFGVSATVVVICSAQTFATYVVSQAIVQLVTAVADGGMAAAVQIIAAAENTDAALIRALQKATNRLAIGLALVSLISVGALSQLPSTFAGQSGVRIAPAFLVLSAAIGIVQARQILWAALIYSGGAFRPYSIALLLPAFLRLGTLAGMFLAFPVITLPILLLNDLASSSVGWLYSSLWLRRRCGPIQSLSSGEVPVLGRQVHRLLRSGFAPAFLGSLGLQAVVLSGGAFAADVAMGTFGVFLRANQIIKVVLDPIMGYGARHLRLALPHAKRRAEAAFVSITVGAYTSLAAAMFTMYVLAGHFFHHYSLGHGSALLLFLIANLFGFLYLTFNSVLLSRGDGSYRLKGTILQVLFSILFVTVQHPSTIWQLCLAQLAAVVPPFAYYSWVCFRPASTPTEWKLWASQSVDAPPAASNTN